MLLYIYIYQHMLKKIRDPHLAGGKTNDPNVAKYIIHEMYALGCLQKRQLGSTNCLVPSFPIFWVALPVMLENHRCISTTTPWAPCGFMAVVPSVTRPRNGSVLDCCGMVNILHQSYCYVDLLGESPKQRGAGGAIFNHSPNIKNKHVLDLCIVGFLHSGFMWGLWGIWFGLSLYAAADLFEKLTGSAALQYTFRIANPAQQYIRLFE